MRYIVAYVALVLIGCHTLHGQIAQNTPPPWPNEPTSFFGVRFGSPIAASIPECRKETHSGVIMYRPDLTGAICFEDHGGRLLLSNVPGFASIWVLTTAGTVSAIEAHSYSQNSQSVLDALIGKFGAPASLDVEKVHNRMGAEFENTRARWIGKNISISFDTVGSQVDRGDLWVTSKDWELSEIIKGNLQRNSIKNSF